MAGSAADDGPRVRIVAYDPTWPQRYEAEAARVATALGPAAIAVEHIGSTAVPGLAAKPTIDILVGVADLGGVDGGEPEAALVRIGYEARGELGVPGRRYFRKGPTYPREFNLHLVEHDGGLWRDNLAFRDHLREDPAAAETYAELKRRLVSGPDGDLLARYAAGKAGFIAAAVAAATRNESRPRGRASAD